MSDDKTIEASNDASGPTQQGKRLTPEDWAKIETHWEYGSMSTKEICAEWKISPAAVTAHFRARPHIVKNSKLAQNKARAAGAPAAPVKPVAVASEFESKKKERIERTKDHIYRSSEANLAMLTRMQKEIIDGTRTIESCKEGFKVLKVAESLINTNLENRFRVLDIENEINEQDLPVLVFEDLTIQEIKTIQEGGGDDEFDIAELPEPSDDDVIEEKPADE